MELLSDFRALLRWFRAAELLTAREAAKLQQRWGESSTGRLVLKTVQELRERLRKDVLTWENGGAMDISTIHELNRLLAEHPMRTRLKANGDVISKELWFEAERPDDLLAPLAHSAALLFAEAERTRVRKCASCVLHFQDISKKGTRRWCSMQLCGNRLKVASYAARQRKA